jgi:hypothetical protein
MKKTILGFIAGIITTLLLLTLFVPALAANLETIEASLNSINLYLNGEKIASIGDSYSLSNGSAVPYTILFKGTTFLPLKEVGRLLGADVKWEGSTRTVNIDTYAINEDVVVFKPDSKSGDSNSLPSPDTKSNSLIGYTFNAFDNQFTVNNMIGAAYYQTYYNGQMTQSEFCDWWNGLSQEYIKEQIYLVIREINSNFASNMPLNINFQMYEEDKNRLTGIFALQVDENGEMYNCTVNQPPHIR